MIFRFTQTLIFLLLPLAIFAQNFSVNRIDPPNWWVGMKNPSVELLVYGEELLECEVTTSYPGVTIDKVTPAETPNYLFVALTISPEAQPGKLQLNFQKGKKKKKFNFPLLARNASKKAQGIGGEDFIYLIMPDRFANGNPDNDVVEGTNETDLRRDSMFYRHGGDLEGIRQRLDYIQELGVTTLWLNPVIENNQPKESYHGYATTDHYKNDPRICTNEEYRDFVNECHARGMKVIMDIVFNHIGNEHPLFKDMPFSNWVHQFPEYTRTSFRATTLIDPYASEADLKRYSNGWFDHHMPDLNQQDEFLARYLIQNSIWWVEFSGIDCFRIDTYAYPDQKFMADWAEALRAEYPNLSLFGETWVHGGTIQSYFTADNGINKKFNNNLPAVTDFQMYYAINAAVNDNFGWTDGVSKLYYTLVKDVLYSDPFQNVTFVDNHDLSRFFSIAQEDPARFKMGLNILLTTRGIPSIYYGTEIAMKNFADPDGKVREDFTGGWKEDAINKFEPNGRNGMEADIFKHVKTLANWRKGNTAVQTGKLMQFIPNEGVYCYFRYDEKSTVMVVVNGNDEMKEIETYPFAERMQGFDKGKDIITGETLPDLSVLRLPARTTLILELQR